MGLNVKYTQYTIILMQMKSKQVQQSESTEVANKFIWKKAWHINQYASGVWSRSKRRIDLYKQEKKTYCSGA